MKNKNTPFTETEEAQIEAWKKEHGEIYIVRSGDKKAFLKAPDRNTVAYASTHIGTNQLAYAETILESCWLGGDEEIKTDDKHFFGVVPQIDSVIEVVESSVEKL